MLLLLLLLLLLLTRRFLFATEMFDPTRPKTGLRSALRLSTFLGLAGGFLFAYQRSSCKLCHVTFIQIARSLTLLHSFL